MLQSDEEASPSATPTEMRGKLRLHPGYHYDPLGRIEMLTNVRGSSAAELQAVFGVDLKELKPFVARYYNARQAWDAWRAAGSREEDVPDVELPQIPEDWLDYFWRHYGPSPQWVLYGGGEHSWSALVRPHLDMPETERLRDELAAVKKEARQRQDEADRLRQALLTDAREKNVRLEVHKEEVQRLRDEADRLQQALADAREKNARLEVHEEEAQRLRDEADRLRQALADAREKNARLEVHEEEAQRLRDEADRLRQALADVREKNARLEATLEERTPPDKNEGNRVPSPPAANSMRPGKK